MKTPLPCVYTKDYYLHQCEGFDIFKRFSGTRLSRRLKTCFDAASVSQNKSILDIGCGRGELVYAAALKKADAVGIDNSNAAIKLCKQLSGKTKSFLKKRMHFYYMDARSISFGDKTFDIIFLLDIIEHLSQHDLDLVLQEARRVLKDNGRIIIHTMPNKLFLQYTYPILRFFYPLLDRIFPSLNRLVYTNPYWRTLHSLPKDPRSHYEKIMHVNEFHYFTLYALLKKHHFSFTIKNVPHLREVHLLVLLEFLFSLISHIFPLNLFLCTELLAVAEK